jgi:PEP-CTERM motif
VPTSSRSLVGRTGLIAAVALFAAMLTTPSLATPFFFSTGNVTNQIAVASRPDVGGLFEIEAADDFVATTPISLTNATFTGLLTGGAIGEVRVEIYRVFPNDSNVARTSGPPTFSTPQVPTRVNSPSDVALDDRDSTPGGGLTFSTTVLNATVTAMNSVQAGGIHPFPNQTTLGNGMVTGQEVQFNITFTDPFALPADHYFFVPQVQVTGGNFLWLSGTRPIVAPGTPFPPGFTDLQSWTRDAMLDPDWLRVGTDIVGTGTFNQAFTLTGVVPEPSTLLLMAAGAFALAWRTRKPTRSSR